MPRIEIPGHYYTSRVFCGMVGSPVSKASQPTSHVAPEQPPVNPIKGCLSAPELLIAQQLAKQGGSATIEAIRAGVAEVSARPNIPTRTIAERLGRLARIGACSQEHLPAGNTSWRLTKVGLAAANQFPASK